MHLFIKKTSVQVRIAYLNKSINVYMDIHIKYFQNTIVHSNNKYM